MIDTEIRISAGHTNLCCGCRHFDARLWDNGHPFPCHQVRWEAEKHHEPSLVKGADGVVTCSDFAMEDTRG